jgi:Holliday junction DNA helicase RuvA
MIGFLSGTLHSKTDNSAVIDVNGVGYEVYLSKKTLESLVEPNSKVRLEIYTHVNETTFQLYGFFSAQEKWIFKKIIAISGVGPKLALTILSALTIPEFIIAIALGQKTTLTNISGIGGKTAERLIIELKDKFKNELVSAEIHAANDDQNSKVPIRDVISALVNLGYQESQARKVVDKLKIEVNDTVQTLIKRSLVNMRN